MRGIAERLVDVRADIRVQADHLANGHGFSSSRQPRCQAKQSRRLRSFFCGLSIAGALPRATKAVETVADFGLMFLLCSESCGHGHDYFALALVALAAGAIIGWLVGSLAAAGASQTVDALRLQLDGVVKERDDNRDAATRLAALEASQTERERGFEARIKELIEAKEALSTQFAEISNKLLAEAQETFLKRADQRFRQSEEHGGQNLKALLQPVHDRLERYETTVQKVEAERRDAFGLLTGQIDAMRIGTERVSRRGGQAGQCAPQRAQGARPLGRAAASRTCSKAAACPNIATSRRR